MSVDLKTCPFCGGEPILRGHDMWPRCSACQCEGPGTSFGMSRKRAITLWNTRTPDPTVTMLETEVERLRATLVKIHDVLFAPFGPDEHLLRQLVWVGLGVGAASSEKEAG